MGSSRQWVLLGAAAQSKARAAQQEDATASEALAAEEKEGCINNLRVIYDAIQAYQFDHKDVPRWLSDLVPDYLSDANVLICPVSRRTGKMEEPPLADPKIACSYLFEFSPVPVPGFPNHTRREWKRRQMGLVGSVVPIVRCRLHQQFLNLGFNGKIYESGAQWELGFTNRVNMSDLTPTSIFGGEPARDEVSAPPPIPSSVREFPRPSKDDLSQWVDLSSYCTSLLTESWQGGSGEDLASLPKGLQTFGGIQFYLCGVVQLRGAAPGLAKFPLSIRGIPVRRRCRRLYFLHAAISGSNADEGEQIGTYILHPLNQATLEIPLIYGRSVRNWHPGLNEPRADKTLKVVWTGENTATKQTGTPVRLFMTAWNLAPGVDIESLDFVSSQRDAAPFLLAITID